MTAAYLSPSPVFQGFYPNGTPLAGGLLYSYAAGTSTPIATYTDNTASTANTNPVVLSASGQANVWQLPNVGYKYVLTDANGNQIWSVDQIYNSQLITYYGTDTGQVNAYTLTAATPYQSYTNGQLVFFVPANSNTGPSTLNVNNLGIIPIVTLTGAAIGAGQITAGIMAECIYYNGNFQLISIGSLTGSTVGTLGQEVAIASAAITDLGTLPAHLGLITGTTSIQSFGSSASTSAPIYFIRFASSLTLQATSATFLPGNASIVTSAGDSAIVQYLGGVGWKVLDYTYASSSSSQSKIKPSDTVLVSNATLTADPDLISNTLAIGRYSYELYLVFDSVSGAAGFKFTNNGTAVDSRALAPCIETGYVNATAVGPIGTTFYGSTISYATVSTASDSNQVILKGSLLVGQAGTFGISWAQNTSTASSTTLRAGSYLAITQISTGSTNNQVVRVYNTAGTGIETVPTGYNTLTIEVFGAGGGGGSRYNTGGGGNVSGGGGGGGGAYVRTIATVTGLGGATIAYTVGAAGIAGNTAGGASSTGATTGGLSLAAMTANGGALGGTAPNQNTGGNGGAGGTASGGTSINQTGNMGTAGYPYSNGGLNSGNGGTGGAGIAGINGGGNAGGRGAGNAVGTNGGVGVIIFTYSP